MPDAIAVDKPINVSFSTYSKDWPVGWVWIDPAEKYNATPHDVKTRVLRINITPKKNLTHEDRTAPRYIKAIKGDFQIETRVKFNPTENFQGAGLLIYANDSSFLTFQRAYGGPGGGGSGFRIDVEKPDGYAPVVTTNDVQSDAAEVELKIARSGNVFAAYWRENDNAEWRLAGEATLEYPETVLAGLVACNTAREVVAEFKYIHLLPVKDKRPTP